MNWPKRRLGDLMEFRNGLSYSAADRGDGLAIVGVADVSCGGRLPASGFDTIRTPSNLAEAAILRPGDLLFVRSNGSRDLVGRCAEVGELDQPTSHSGFTIRARFIDPEVNPKWVAAFFACGLGDAALGRGTRGTNINNLRQERLQGIEIYLPLRNEQDHLLGLLSHFDAAIFTIDAAIDAKRRLHDELIRRSLFGNAYDSDPIRLAEAVELVTERYRGAIAVGSATCIEMENIERDSGRLVTCGGNTTSTSQKTRFRKDDTLFGKLRPYLRKFYFARHDGFCSTEFWVLRPEPSLILPGYLPLILQSEVIRRATSKTSGTKMPRADWQTVRATTVTLPSLSRQQEIVALFDCLNSQIDALRDLKASREMQRRVVQKRVLQGCI